MSDCGICLSNEGADEIVELLHEEEMTASRKTHRCLECGQEIPAGSAHQLHSGKCDGYTMNYRTCLLCAEIRRSFSCGNGWVYGALWDDLEYAFEEGINEMCFSKLETADAKRYLRERWMKWKGLAS